MEGEKSNRTEEIGKKGGRQGKEPVSSFKK
jgi:hypothetical protein